VIVAVPVADASGSGEVIAGVSFAGNSVCVNVGLAGVLGDVELPQPAAARARATAREARFIFRLLLD
jgi:hypothetical protein